MPLPLILAPLFAQAAIVSPGAAPALPQAPLQIPRKRKVIEAGPPEPPSMLAQCLALVRSSPPAAIDFAQGWLGQTTGSARAEPGRCLGLALASLERFGEAEEAFLQARNDAAPSDMQTRAVLGARAANAAFAGEANDRALALLDQAHGDALAAGDARLAGETSIDRARVLVALGRTNDAAAALAEARTAAPDNPLGWLLSATLSRREGRLDEAQQQIERAADLLPVDPEIGLEAGVIAALSGRDAAARRSFQSVLVAAPGSEFAKKAQGYLDQLPPEDAPSGR